VANDLKQTALDTLSRLLGAAVALGAETVPGLSKSERHLLKSTNPTPLSPAEIRSLKEAIHQGFDPLGEAFCKLFSSVERRVDGATYTPGPVVQAMARWASEGVPPTRIIDPGSGSARFAVASGLIFKKAELVAIELDPVAALLSRANLATQGMARRAQVVVSDYRCFVPDSIKGPTLYVGNPPYVRHHNIDPAWKKWLTRTAGERGLTASQLAGLHVYFFLATVQNASRGDRGVFVTSSEWLDVNYGALVRELVLDGLGGQAIHVLDPQVEPFEDAQTTGAITCFEIGATPRSIRLRRVKSVADLGTLGGGQRVRRERLAEARRWTPLLRTARKIPEGHIELGEVFRVHRGAVTGANRIWVVDPNSTDLPKKVIFPTVTRARELFAAGEKLANLTTLRAVVDLPDDLDLLDSTEDRRSVERFLRIAKREGVHNGYIARHRKSWWSVGLRRPAPILATYMARRSPAIVRNPAEARHINIAHGLYPRETLNADQLDCVANALRESISVHQGRTYAGGLTKFEPKEFERILIPNVLELSA
jgi:adenine-specific DNA-methyltransferase